MRYLPSSSIALAENDVAAGKVIKSKTMDDMMYSQGTTYAHRSFNGSTFYLGDMETSETTYSYLNEGSEPGYQLDEWRPAFYPIRKMQDDLQVPFDETLPISRKNIDGNYYVVISGYGYNCTASFDLFPLNETGPTSLGGASSLSSTSAYTRTLTFDATGYGYKEVWALISDAGLTVGMSGSVVAGEPITGFRAELEAKVTSGTGYMKYVCIEECKKVNHTTYIDYVRIYGDEIIEPVPSGEALTIWRSDGVAGYWTQTTPGKKPVITSDPANFNYATFDSSNDCVVNSGGDFKCENGMYFAANINPDAGGVGTNRYLLDHRNDATYASRILLNTSNKVQFASTNTAGTNALISNASIAAGVWTDVACVIYPDPDRPGYDRKEIWLNGELDNVTYNLPPYVSDTASPCQLGGVTTSTVPFDGAIACPIIIAIEGDLSGSFDHRDINGLNLSWRRAWGMGT